MEPSKKQRLAHHVKPPPAIHFATTSRLLSTLNKLHALGLDQPVFLLVVPFQPGPAHVCIICAPTPRHVWRPALRLAACLKGLLRRLVSAGLPLMAQPVRTCGPHGPPSGGGQSAILSAGLAACRTHCLKMAPQKPIVRHSDQKQIHCPAASTPKQFCSHACQDLTRPGCTHSPATQARAVIECTTIAPFRAGLSRECFPWPIYEEHCVAIGLVALKRGCHLCGHLSLRRNASKRLSFSILSVFSGCCACVPLCQSLGGPSVVQTGVCECSQSIVPPALHQFALI